MGASVISWGISLHGADCAPDSLRHCARFMICWRLRYMNVSEKG